MTESSASTLWELIEALPGTFPLARERIEPVLKTKLSEASGPPPLVVYEGSGAELADQLWVERIELRTQPANAAFGLLTLDLSGRCVPLSEVRQHYAMLEITQVPRGRSPQERTVHSVELEWGRLSFGFRESNRDCLANVGFRLR